MGVWGRGEGSREVVLVDWTWICACTGLEARCSCDEDWEWEEDERREKGRRGMQRTSRQENVLRELCTWRTRTGISSAIRIATLKTRKTVYGQGIDVHHATQNQNSRTPPSYGGE